MNSLEKVNSGGGDGASRRAEAQNRVVVRKRAIAGDAKLLKEKGAERVVGGGKKDGVVFLKNVRAFDR